MTLNKKGGAMERSRALKMTLAFVLVVALFCVRPAGAESGEGGGSNVNVNGGFSAFTGFNTLTMTYPFKKSVLS